MSQLNRSTVEEFKGKNKMPIVIVLDNIRSLNNVGSVFRTSDAFSIQSIYLCGITGTPPHKEIHKSALGSTDSVDWVYFEKTTDAVEALKEMGYIVFALEQTDESISLENFIPPVSPLAFVFGNEVEGVADEVLLLVNDAIEIPQFGTKHSFNISVSAGILLWDIIQKIKKGK
ncbi:MAG: tRNA (guanosine(18)-2'-O)-methyltransferase [Bacteroidetes bacterium ADurb.Bin408]|nr:MAG: tRNA (guanosine(18)-2'-O)-methyltransferase [Bacteroidetes bacterium ADurb.Bin408]